MTVYVKDHPHLSRKVCFKPVIDWMRDAFGTVAFLPEGAPLPDDGLVLDEPILPSLLIKGGGLPAGTPEELQEARRIMRDKIIQYHIQNGVDITDPPTTFIGPDVTIGEGTTVLPCVVIQGRVSIGPGCELGPFTHIRPDVSAAEGVRLGAYVEVKNSVLGAKTHAGHLTYIGDADVGANVNFGCGTVVVNYNGAQKFRTAIEDGAFIGCNTNLVAPVTVGREAYTAAGSTVTQDVPPGALAIARERQTNKENWKKPEKKV